ncbi:MAG: GNAT family N-acetyltransferase [candidate division WOR-3 bacterium]|nr:GNAT family N-acetyltransferase [candidate division WOR-3 bacterium]MCX7947404.1 GNAT family N-acetyltransferase [candidate division WOR-3 bacterium]MDW8151198.1 GNAT family N-acetyltransferase [candidate division WOR-3 bacterium]
MKESFLLCSKEIFDIFFNYVKSKYSFKDLGNGFIIRKVGRIKRLHYAIDDLVDWWDLEISKDEIEKMLKREIYYKAVFKNILEFSRIKQILDSSETKPKVVEFSKVYYINLLELDSPEKILRSLSYKWRRNIKNSINRLKKLNYEFSKMESFKPYFNLLVNFITSRHIETTWIDSLYQRAMFNVFENFENLGILDTFVLKANNDIIAINLVINYNKKAFWWASGFKEDFYYFSPNKMSVWFMLLYYIEKNYHEFNFMKGESEYKTIWTKDFYKLYRYEFEHPNLIKKFFSLL